jgi:hypothetical protein
MKVLKSFRVSKDVSVSLVEIGRGEFKIFAKLISEDYSVPVCFTLGSRRSKMYHMFRTFIKCEYVLEDMSSYVRRAFADKAAIIEKKEGAL